MRESFLIKKGGGSTITYLVYVIISVTKTRVHSLHGMRMQQKYFYQRVRNEKSFVNSLSMNILIITIFCFSVGILKQRENTKESQFFGRTTISFKILVIKK